jgi:hypothetical protein
MSSWDIIKTVVLLIVMFPFVVLLSYFGYLVLFGWNHVLSYPSVWFTPGNAGFQALASGCAVGLAVGTLVGYRIGTEKESMGRELA